VDGPVAPAREDRTSTDHGGSPCGAKAECNALHRWLRRLWDAVDTRDELFAICVAFEGLCVDKPSERLAGVSHSFRTTFLPWAGVASVIAADDVVYGSRPPPHPPVQ
jgi:hypothetical protein